MVLEKKAWHWGKGAWHRVMLKGARGNTNSVQFLDKFNRFKLA